MMKILGLLALVSAAFYAGIWFEKTSSFSFGTHAATPENIVSSPPQLRSYPLDHPQNYLQNHASSNNSALTISSANEQCNNSNELTIAEFQINKSSLEDVLRFLAHTKPSADEIISLYVKAIHPDVQQGLRDALSNRLAENGRLLESSIALADSLMDDANPKTRQLAYALLANIDSSGSDVAIQLIDASYTETNAKATLKLVEAMANSCADATQTVLQQCIERMVNVIEFSASDVATNSLILLSRMPSTQQSISVFSNKLNSDIPAQKITALDGLFNAKTLDKHTLDAIRHIANDEEASVNIRDLANELLRHFENDLHS